MRRDRNSRGENSSIKIEMILGLQKVDQIKRQRDGTTVMRIIFTGQEEVYRRAVPGRRFVEYDHVGPRRVVAQLRNRPRAPSSSVLHGRVSTGFHRVADDVTQAQRHLRKALRDAEEKGWEADPHDLEVIRRAFQEKNEPVVCPRLKPGLRSYEG